MTGITTTKLYRHTSTQLADMIAVEIADLTEQATKRPDWVTNLANSIERLRGQYDTLRHLEQSFHSLEVWAVENRWTEQQLLLAKYDDAATLATLPPNDSVSGHGNDGRRAYNEGRRDVLAYVFNRLRSSQWFPGNELAGLDS